MDDLLDNLVADLKPVRRRTAAGDALWLALLCAGELAAFLAMGDLRPDFMPALQLPSMWWKLLGFGGLALVGMVTAVRSFDPSVSPKRSLAWLTAAAVAVLAAGALVVPQPPRDHMVHMAHMAHRMNWVSGVHCIGWTAVLSLPALAMLALLMRRGAPTHGRATAWAVGVAAAAWGAFVFVFGCPHDDPLYVALWYGLGCALVAVVARLLLPRLARW